MNLEERVKQLGFSLPPAPKPAGAYTPVVFTGSLALISGQISKKPDGTILSGKAGGELDLAGARKAAEAAALNILSVIHNLIGEGKVVRFLRVVGFVQTTPDFYDISKVMDAASELFQRLFGEQGIHARTSVGVASLPLNAAVEIEVTLQILPF